MYQACFDVVVFNPLVAPEGSCGSETVSQMVPLRHFD